MPETEAQRAARRAARERDRLPRIARVQQLARAVQEERRREAARIHERIEEREVAQILRSEFPEPKVSPDNRGLKTAYSERAQREAKAATSKYKSVFDHGED